MYADCNPIAPFWRIYVDMQSGCLDEIGNGFRVRETKPIFRRRHIHRFSRAAYEIFDQLPSMFTCSHFFFFASIGTGVCKIARNASSNLTPLRFGSMTGSGCFLCFALFAFGTNSLSPPWNMRGFLFYKAVLQAVKPVPSNHLPVG
jgi:hypothetical protein